MALKIIKATDPIHVSRVILNLYSEPGLGKTTLACTAEKPLLFDFDGGSHRAKNRPETVRVERWDDVVNMEASDFAGVKTVIVDTAGRALDILTPAIIRLDPKFGRKSGALSLQGYGELRSTFLGWLNMLKSYGLDVVTVCHSEEQKRGDEVITRLDVQGGSKQEIYKSADAMGRLYLENNKRILNFSPTDVAFGKNPGELPPLDVPDYRTTPDFLSQVIASIKSKLNELTAAQAAAAAAQGEWKGKFEAALTADDFTALMDPVRNADKSISDSIRPLMIQIAKGKGFTVSKDRTKFEPIPGAAPAAGLGESPKAGAAPSGEPSSVQTAAEAKPSSSDAGATAEAAGAAEYKGDAPTAAELAADKPAQAELPTAKKSKGKAA